MKTYTHHIKRCGYDKVIVTGPFAFVPEKWAHVDLEKEKLHVNEPRCFVKFTANGYKYTGLYNVETWYEFQE